MTYLNKLKSRKFQMAIGSILVTLGSAMQGQISWGTAILGIISVALVYMGVEGAIDEAREKSA